VAFQSWNNIHQRKSICSTTGIRFGKIIFNSFNDISSEQTASDLTLAKAFARESERERERERERNRLK